jgi:hypothetical protein
MVGPQQIYFRGDVLVFICQEHSVFHSYRLTSVLFFLLLHLTFVFHLDFCSDLILSVHQGVFGPLVYVGIHQKSCFKKVQMVLEKRKVLCKKVVQKGACLDCGLDFFISYLMSF